jgi:hypothetical protein
MMYSWGFTVYYFDPNVASLLHGTVHSRTGVRQGDPLGPLSFNLGIINCPLRNIGERFKGSSAIQAFSDDGKCSIKTHFVPTVTAVAMEEMGKICLRVQPIKSLCIYTAPELVEVIPTNVPVVTGTKNLGAFSTSQW